MNKLHNPNLAGLARELRNRATPEENHLWYDCLKRLDIVVRRQRDIGPYIVDFYCPAAKLAIELDGSQHYEETGRKKDEERDAYLNEQGIKVLRYPNAAIRKQFSDVCEEIMRNMEQRTGKKVMWKR